MHPTDGVYPYRALASLFTNHLSNSVCQALAKSFTSTEFTNSLRLALVGVFVLSIPFIFNYVATWLFFQVRHWSKEAAKIPPTIPHLVPWIGSSLSLAFNAFGFVKWCTERFGQQTPFHVALPTFNLYFVQGSESILSLWKQSGSMTGTPIHLFCLKYLFGMPPEALKMYEADNSGIGRQALPGSHVEPHNRIDHRIHAGLVKFTSGSGLQGFYERWSNAYKERLQSLDIGNDWVEMPDFMTFFSDTFGSAVIESICGPTLLHMYPYFGRDFIKFDLAVPDLAKGLPRWMVPQSYRARDKLLSSIKRWHDAAREQHDQSSTKPVGDTDPYWGSAFIRERHSSDGIFSTADNFDKDAGGASDLGIIWAAVTNIVPSSMWSTLETFKHASLLTRARAELEVSFSPAALSDANFSSQILVTLPLLQSIYAETLRLRVRAYAARYTDQSELQLNEWIFPKNSVLLVATTPSHMDSAVWNTKNGNHPVDTFWADRFLEYPGDPSSGPVKRPATQDGQQPALSPTNATATGPKFSMSGTNGIWIPYGGGPRVCVGRTFSKRAIIAASAFMIALFDVEILADDKALRMDPKFYGLGGQMPMGKVPFRIRKRQ